MNSPESSNFSPKDFNVNLSISKSVQSQEKRRSKLTFNGGQSSWGFVDLDNPEQLKMGAAARFYEHRDQFINMTKRQKIPTTFDIINIIVTNDEKHVVVLLQIEFEVKFQI